MKYKPEQQKEFQELSFEFLVSDVPVHQLDSLREVIRYHEYRYSVLNDPVIADVQFDQLLKKLEAIEKAHPELITADSPSQRVTSDISNLDEAVPHLQPMLSLANSYDASDLIDFDTSVKKLAGLTPTESVIYSVEPKFDGGSIGLVYENDYLVRAATRGDGLVGEDITANMKTLASIPLKADFSSLGIQTAELRGEALIRKDIFAEINQKRQKEQKSLFANPRNAATGGLRTKDPLETKERGIEAFIFQLGYAVDSNGQDQLSKINSHYEAITSLGNLGFKIPTNQLKRCHGIDEVISFCNYWEEQRDSYPYEIDGMVVKVDNLSTQKLLGATQHHPRSAIAFKFKARQATTKLLDIEYQVGKVGSITPVAKLLPVQLAGVTISSVSLHNEDFIKTKDLRLGDTVLVERAGDVIPYIVKANSDLRDGTEKLIVFPTSCPSCGSTLQKSETEAAWRCNNLSCEAQVLQRLAFHVSKDAMDIDGFGKSNIERFYQLGWVKDIADIYTLDYDAIAKLEGFGPKSASNIQAAVDKAKSNPLHRLLHSLSIHHLGKKASKLIAEHIASVFDLTTISQEELLSIKDIGPVVAQNIAEWFSIQQNIDILYRMQASGVNLSQTAEDKPRNISSESPLAGKKILFTGTLSQMGRKEAQDLAEQLGATNISAVSKNLDILVVGENAGSKLAKAQSVGTITIWTEEEFLSEVNQNQNG